MSIRLIQVGVGVRGSHWAKVIAAAPHAEVAAYVDVRLDVARERAAAWGQADVPCFDDLEAALREVEADAVLLVTPPQGHREQAELAFKHGLDVLCEKPLAENLEEAIAIVRQAETRGRRLMVGMNFRYLPVSQALRRLIREERFGTPGYGHFVYLRNRDGQRADLNKYPLTMEQPMLLEQSIHHLDLMRYCYAAEVESVSADTWRPSWSTYADDCCVSTLLHFEGGLRVNYIGTWTAGWNRFVFEWRTDCSDGVLIQKEQFGELYTAKLKPGLAMEGRLFKSPGEAERLEPVPLEPAEDFITDTAGLLGEFVAAVEGRAPLVTSGRDHLRTLALVFASIKAAETGQRVFLQEFYDEVGIAT